MAMSLQMGLGLTASTLTKGVGGIIRSIFADGTDGFYFDFSKTDRLFQDLAGTPADGAGENIYLGLEGHSWGGKTLAQFVASQPELWTAALVSITNGSGSVGSYDSGTDTMSNSGAAVVSYPRFNFPLGLVAGRYYQVTGQLAGDISQVAQIRLANSGSSNNLTYNSSTGEISGIAISASGALQILTNLDGAESVTITSLSVKEIPGNHGLQATTAAQPKWQTGGLARFDGSDDNLLTTLNPAASFSMMFKGKITSASKIVMGSRATTDTRAFIGTDAAGLLAAGVGADSTTTIKGGSDIRGTTGVGALVFDASTVKLYWNGASIYSAAINGSPNTTIPLRLGAFNDNGTAGAFADADLYHALAIKKALTAAQIAAITNLWGTT